jgi:type III restriction enzyme
LPRQNHLERLRELSDVPYERLLPPRMHKPFAASLKLTFTRDGDKQIPIVWGSSFNVIVTNTEKIRIQKPNAVRQRATGAAVCGHQDGRSHRAGQPAPAGRGLAAALGRVLGRSPPHLWPEAAGQVGEDKETGELVFKDDGIKKVRRTIDYLAEETNLIVTINATGTPYFERQPLRDVVVWYGLGEGIRDGVLKELANNIKVLDLGDGEADTLVPT